jgi:hypothetical protein
MMILVRGMGSPKDPVFSYNHGLLKFDKESRFVSQYYAIHQRETSSTRSRWRLGEMVRGNGQRQEQDQEQGPEQGQGHILPERSPRSQTHRLTDVGTR